MKIFEVLLRR